MKKQLLIFFLQIVCFSAFANDFKQPDLSISKGLSQTILFVDFEKLKDESIEFNFLEARIKVVRFQLDLVLKAVGDCDAYGGPRTDKQKMNQIWNIVEEAKKVWQPQLASLEKAQQLFAEKVKDLIKEIGSKIGANAVLDKRAYGIAGVAIKDYVVPENDITHYLIGELNKAYQESEKQVFPTCDLSSYVNRIVAIGNVRLK